MASSMVSKCADSVCAQPYGYKDDFRSFRMVVSVGMGSTERVAQ